MSKDQSKAAIDGSMEQKLRDYREKHFAIELKKTRHGQRDEQTVSITHNGYQWQSFSLTRKEIKTLLSVLKKAIK